MILHEERLDKVHPDLVEIFKFVGKTWNILIICGYRGKEEQNKAYSEGKSKLRYPLSAHNLSQPRAVDVCPVDMKNQPIWKDGRIWTEFRHFMEEVAKEKGIKLKPEIKGDANHFELQ